MSQNLPYNLICAKNNNNNKNTAQLVSRDPSVERR
jgi:hypothetical protein